MIWESGKNQWMEEIGLETPTQGSLLQGSFCECAQPMRDDVTMQRRLSLAGPIHKIIPAFVKGDLLNQHQDQGMDK